MKPIKNTRVEDGDASQALDTIFKGPVSKELREEVKNLLLKSFNMTLEEVYSLYPGMPRSK